TNVAKAIVSVTGVPIASGLESAISARARNARPSMTTPARTPTRPIRVPEKTSASIVSSHGPVKQRWLTPLVQVAVRQRGEQSVVPREHHPVERAGLDPSMGRLAH